MAKKTSKILFSKAIISKEQNGTYIITEISKDNISDYNLTQILDEWSDVDNITFSMSTEDEIQEK